LGDGGRLQAEPERHGELALGWLRREFAEALELEPGGFQPAAELIAGKAEAPMRRLLAQELELVRREVDHEQLAARPEQTRGFCDRRSRVVEKVQHLMQHDGVGGAVGQRYVIEI